MRRLFVLTLSLFFVLSLHAQPKNDTQQSTDNASIAELQKRLKLAQASGKEPDVLVKCSYDDQVCDPAILYVSGSVVSHIQITDLPAGEVVVRVTSGEMNGAYLSPFVDKTYATAPDLLTIAIQRKRQSSFGKDVNDLLNADKADQNPMIRFLTFGRAPTISIQISPKGVKTKTISVPIRYQPWFVDMGGFMAFAAISDQELLTTSVGNDRSKVTKKRNKDSMTPVTGAVLNLHPANIPVLALQFGLATNSNRQPSFFAGAGWRLREFGARSLVTAAIGVAAVPSLRFPDLKVGDERANGDVALKGTTSYRYAPYASLTFGFTFGDTTPANKSAQSAPPAANIPVVATK
jgi:hypothetical protein